MISVGTCRIADKPVEILAFSTVGTHRATALTEPNCSVFPLVHTPYDFYERI